MIKKIPNGITIILLSCLTTMTSGQPVPDHLSPAQYVTMQGFVGNKQQASYENRILAQDTEAVKKAIQSGDARKYEEAISILETETKMNPSNAIAFYWLARYAHYIVYDSRPFTKKSDAWSKNKVLANLKKAITLKPDFGDAYYFIAVEYGCRAREALKQKDTRQARIELIAAKKSGGFPEYALEYARCILNSCDKNAILFSNWDAAVNALTYVQLVEGLRKDISLIIVNLLERPYYIKLISNGIPNEIQKVPISWNENLVMEMQSYFPWKENTIKIPISKLKKSAYNLPDSVNEISLSVKSPYGGDALWIGTAAILNLLENNKFERPVYCALPRGDDMFSFTDYLKNEGFVSKLMPYKVKGSDNEYDKDKFESSILNSANYKHFNEIKFHNQPRAAYFFGDNRRNIIADYLQFLILSNKKEEAKAVYLKMNLLMPVSDYPLSGDLEIQYKKIEKQIRTN